MLTIRSPTLQLHSKPGEALIGNWLSSEVNGANATPVLPSASRVANVFRSINNRSIPRASAIHVPANECKASLFGDLSRRVFRVICVTRGGRWFTPAVKTVALRRSCCSGYFLRHREREVKKREEEVKGKKWKDCQDCLWESFLSKNVKAFVASNSGSQSGMRPYSKRQYAFCDASNPLRKLRFKDYTERRIFNLEDRWHAG